MLTPLPGGTRQRLPCQLIRWAESAWAGTARSSCPVETAWETSATHFVGRGIRAHRFRLTDRDLPEFNLRMYQDDLAKLSKEELIALALAQTAQIEELTRRIADLEAKLGGPPKTPDNSSLPPSQGRKPNRAERRAAQKRKGRPGVFRALAPNPDRIVARVAERCPHCDHALTPADQSGFHAYDHIELPPIRPVITRMHRHRGVCPSCRRGFSAPPPAGIPPGSPFGPGLVALIVHLHVTQAIGFERLWRRHAEAFALSTTPAPLS